MDWLLFVFKKGKHFYLVNADSESDAWERLQKRQSMRMELIKQQYTLIHILTDCSYHIIKL